MTANSYEAERGGLWLQARVSCLADPDCPALLYSAPGRSPRARSGRLSPKPLIYWARLALDGCHHAGPAHGARAHHQSAAGQAGRLMW